MNTGENRLSRTFTLFPLAFPAVKLTEATSYRMYPKGYNPLLSALPSSFDYIGEGITPELTSHTLTPKKGWRLRCPHHHPRGCTHKDSLLQSIQQDGERQC